MFTVQAASNSTDSAKEASVDVPAEEPAPPQPKKEQLKPVRQDRPAGPAAKAITPRFNFATGIF